jgi:hypothetical protein
VYKHTQRDVLYDNYVIVVAAFICVYLCLGAIFIDVCLQLRLKNTYSTQLTRRGGVRALAKVGLFVGVSPLPITAIVRAPDLEIVDLQPDGVVGKRVAE